MLDFHINGVRAAQCAALTRSRVFRACLTIHPLIRTPFEQSGLTETMTDALFAMCWREFTFGWAAKAMNTPAFRLPGDLRVTLEALP